MEFFNKYRRLIVPSLIVIGIIFVLTFIGVAAYGWSLSKNIEKRFSGRKWSIPSKVYSDSTIIYPGQNINPALFIDKLKRLGYREVFNKPEQKGEMHRDGSTLYIYLNDLNLPSQKREGVPVKLILGQEYILNITSAQNGASIPLLELEAEELGLLFGPEREQRRLISLADVPDQIQKAFLAAEDSRFYHHSGLDFRGIFRAIYKNLRKKGVYQGGSTITQQLAKNYFLTPERTLSRKLKEMLLAIILEIKYEKNEILEIYLNEIYFGQKGSIAVNGLGGGGIIFLFRKARERTDSQ
jgi:penicillin-binding protein 1B